MPPKIHARRRELIARIWSFIQEVNLQFYCLPEHLRSTIHITQSLADDFAMYVISWTRHVKDQFFNNAEFFVRWEYHKICMEAPGCTGLKLMNAKGKNVLKLRFEDMKVLRAMVGKMIDSKFPKKHDEEEAEESSEATEVETLTHPLEYLIIRFLALCEVMVLCNGTLEDVSVFFLRHNFVTMQYWQTEKCTSTYQEWTVYDEENKKWASTCHRQWFKRVFRLRSLLPQVGNHNVMLTVDGIFIYLIL
jgi:hypothetical protein